MFGNRHFYLKGALAAALFAASSFYCYKRGLFINPSVRLAGLIPGEYDGTVLWIPVSRVESIDENGFVVAASDGKIRVIGRAEGIAIGDAVEMTGRFRAPSTLELHRVRKASAVPWRRIVEVLSVLVLLAVLLLFLRRFRVRRGAWEMRWPTS